jgi:hypothetical protein
MCDPRNRRFGNFSPSLTMSFVNIPDRAAPVLDLFEQMDEFGELV